MFQRLQRWVRNEVVSKKRSTDAGHLVDTVAWRRDEVTRGGLGLCTEPERTSSGQVAPCPPDFNTRYPVLNYVTSSHSSYNVH